MYEDILEFTCLLDGSACKAEDLASLYRGVTITGRVRKTGHSPPPTRHMTFLVIVFSAPVRPDLVKVVNRQVTTFLESEFEKAYEALISSPSFGIVLRGGSTRSIKSP